MKTTKTFIVFLCSLLLSVLLASAAFAGHIDTAFNPTHLKAINSEREKHGLDPVTMSRKLNEAIAIRAREQVDLYGHTRPDGRDCWSVLADVDPDFEWSPSGENCFKGPTTVKAAMEGWMNSTGHRSNILYEDCTRVGIATYVGDDGTLYWVQMFSRNAPDADYYGEDDGDNGGDGGYGPSDQTTRYVPIAGGCSAAGAASIALLALAMFALRRKS